MAVRRVEDNSVGRDGQGTGDGVANLCIGLLQEGTQIGADQDGLRLPVI